MPILNSTKFTKTALIFGGSGFVGSHLCEHLLTSGYEVIVADIEKSSNPNVSYVYCDVRNAINFVPDKKPNIVFNLAAVHRTPGHETGEYYETNLFGALNIIQWCDEQKITTIVFTSSISVYGIGVKICNEQSALNPNHAYGKSKVLAEKIHGLWQLQSSKNRTLIICRPAVIFGRGESGNFTRLAKGLRNRYFFIPGNKETIKACGYVKDLVRSFTFVIDKSKPGITTYNFSFPDQYSISQICRAFHQVAGYSYPLALNVFRFSQIIFHLPKPFDRLGQRLLKLSKDSRVVPEKLQELGFQWNMDLTSALKDWMADSKRKGYFD